MDLTFRPAGPDDVDAIVEQIVTQPLHPRMLWMLEPADDPIAAYRVLMRNQVVVSIARGAAFRCDATASVGWFVVTNPLGAMAARRVGFLPRGEAATLPVACQRRIVDLSRAARRICPPVPYSMLTFVAGVDDDARLAAFRFWVEASRAAGANPTIGVTPDDPRIHLLSAAGLALYAEKRATRRTPETQVWCGTLSPVRIL